MNGGRGSREAAPPGGLPPPPRALPSAGHGVSCCTGTSLLGSEERRRLGRVRWPVFSSARARGGLRAGCSSLLRGPSARLRCCIGRRRWRCPAGTLPGAPGAQSQAPGWSYRPWLLLGKQSSDRCRQRPPLPRSPLSPKRRQAPTAYRHLGLVDVATMRVNTLLSSLTLWRHGAGLLPAGAQRKSARSPQPTPRGRASTRPGRGPEHGRLGSCTQPRPPRGAARSHAHTPGLVAPASWGRVFRALRGPASAAGPSPTTPPFGSFCSAPASFPQMNNVKRESV